MYVSLSWVSDIRVGEACPQTVIVMRLTTKGIGGGGLSINSYSFSVCFFF